MLRKASHKASVTHSRRRGKMSKFNRELSRKIDVVTILLEDGNAVERAFAKPMLAALERRIPVEGRRR